MSRTRTKVQIYAQKEYDKQRRQRRVEIINNIKQEKGCLYCGSRNKLQFHHRDPLQKFKKIGAMWSYTQERFYDEIEKCDVVCKKCHIEMHRYRGRTVIVVAIPIYIPIPMDVIGSVA